MKHRQAAQGAHWGGLKTDPLGFLCRDYSGGYLIYREGPTPRQFLPCVGMISLDNLNQSTPDIMFAMSLLLHAWIQYRTYNEIICVRVKWWGRWRILSFVCCIQCVVCGNIPQDGAKSLPCLHNVCRSCFDLKFQNTASEAGDRNRHHCPLNDCQQPFRFLRDPESGCKPLKTEEFTADCLSDPEYVDIIRDSNYKVDCLLASVQAQRAHNVPEYPFDDKYKCKNTTSYLPVEGLDDHRRSHEFFLFFLEGPKTRGAKNRRHRGINRMGISAPQLARESGGTS